MSATLLILAAALQSASGAPDDLERKVLDRFTDLPEAERAAIVEHAERRLLEEGGHPLVVAARGILEHPRVREAETLDPDPRRAHDADRWAPALELDTEWIRPGTRAWQRVERRFFRSVALPDRGARWRWDPGRDAFVRPREERPPRDRLLALMRGRWPEDDRIQACVMAVLDDDDGLDAVADYFAHHYRDRAGRVYERVQLYDVWSSGVEFEVSDVEAIAWLRLIEDEDGIRSPIPGRLHDRIYRRIERGFVPYRDYLGLRRALAVRALTPWADPGPAWRGVTDRLDWAWALSGHDPDAMLALLGRHPQRGDFLGAVAERAAAARDGSEDSSLATALDARATLQAHVAAFAREFVREQGLLGFRMR